MSEENNRPTPDALDEATRALRDASIPPGPPAELTAATLAAMQQRLNGTVPVGEPARRHRRRRLMRFAGYGIAAAVAVTVVLVLAAPSPAARVQKAMAEAAKAKSVRITIALVDGDGKPEVGIVAHVERERSRWDRPTKDVTSVWDNRTKQGLTLNHKTKTAALEKLAGQELDDAVKQHEVFFNPLGAARDIKDMTVKELDSEKIDGRAMKVFMLSHPDNTDHAKMTAFLWIDKETELPRRLKLPGDSGEKDTVWEFEDWNEKFDDKLFSLDVPGGYKEGVPGQAPPTPELLFVRAMDRVSKATSMRAVIALDSGGGQKIQMKLYEQPPHMRSEVAEPGLVVILDSKEKKGLVLFTQGKTAQRLDLEKNAQVAKIATDVGGAMNVVGKLKGEKVAALPGETLDGRKLKVYEMKGLKTKELPGGTDIKVWIDPKALLPVRAQLRSKQGDKTVTITIDVLGWNEELDEKIFELAVPAGYKVIEAVEMK